MLRALLMDNLNGFVPTIIIIQCRVHSDLQPQTAQCSWYRLFSYNSSPLCCSNYNSKIIIIIKPVLCWSFCKPATAMFISRPYIHTGGSHRITLVTVCWPPCVILVYTNWSTAPRLRKPPPSSPPLLLSTIKWYS